MLTGLLRGEEFFSCRARLFYLYNMAHALIDINQESSAFFDSRFSTSTYMQSRHTRRKQRGQSWRFPGHHRNHRVRGQSAPHNNHLYETENLMKGTKRLLCMEDTYLLCQGWLQKHPLCLQLQQQCTPSSVLWDLSYSMYPTNFRNCPCILSVYIL